MMALSRVVYILLSYYCGYAYNKKIPDNKESKMKYDADNIFAKIIKGDIPANKVYEDDDILAFRDINPQAPVHILLIPKQSQISMLGDCSDDDIEVLGKLNVAAAKVAKQENLDSFRVIVNSGSGAGQTVFHLHMHLLGGREFGESII